MAGLARGNVAKQMRDHALRKVVSLDLVVQREALQFWHQPPVTANRAPDHSGVSKMIKSTGFAIALAGGVDEREIARLVAVWPDIRGVKKKRFQR